MGEAGGASTLHRVRGVLGIPAFRRLWIVNTMCGTCDWLTLLALSALATKLTSGYQAQSFALGGVVATKLLPAMLLAPLAGAIADKFDRRRTMVICDILRACLLISIPVVGTLAARDIALGWLFIAVFLIEICALFWIPAKDAAIPNLLKRPDQVETANQLALVMTYGVAVVTAAGLFSALSAIGPTFHVPLSSESTVYIALGINAIAYISMAIMVGTRIPEISGRARREGKVTSADTPNLLVMLRDGMRFVGTTPLIRGLVVGILGAFAAGGAVIASAKLYAGSLSGGDAAYGMLFVSVFVGLGTGMFIAPKFTERLAHNRLFGVAIVSTGLLLMVVAIAPQLWIALLAVIAVGLCAGVAFLTGLTIIGTQVDDAIRGRTMAFVQSLVRVVLLAAMALVPVLVGLVQSQNLSFFGTRIDATRPVLLGAGLLAAVLGIVAYQQMNRTSKSLVDGLFAALRRPSRTDSGLLIVVEGETVEDTGDQASLLADWLAGADRDVVLIADPTVQEHQFKVALAATAITGPRSSALLAAAVRAEIVDTRVRPALREGAIVIMQRFVHSPAARLGAAAGLDATELDTLSDWASGTLRPDISVLLDRGPTAGPQADPAQHWRAQHLISELAAERYVVVDAEGPAIEVGQRVRLALRPVLSSRQIEVSEPARMEVP
ncbi:MFS transporter [Pseudonocardiaceae bacterium YIM PH 21723]|nr:MFS transporter [Pseudonocardiaceae bacterium YIM PH 21723]